MAQVQVQHRDGSDGKHQPHGQRIQPGLLGQQPDGAGEPADEGHGKAGQGDFQALAVQSQINHVAQNGPQQQGEAQAVKAFEPDRRHQLRTVELPVRLDPEQHQQRQTDGRQQQLADNRDHAKAPTHVSGQRKQD